MKDTNSRMLRKLGNEEAFYFFTDIGNYTGQSACSLEEFLSRITDIDAKSLKFHLFRQDFEKWMSSTIGDARLAEDIRLLRLQKVAGSSLRNHLSLLVSKRLKELKIASNVIEGKKQTKKKRVFDGH
jgi:hypothetical protein